MALHFNSILLENGIDPGQVRLLRHKDQRALKGLGPYELWRDSRSDFENYQSTQSFDNRGRLSSQFWASFVGTPADETLFVGLYQVEYMGTNTQEEVAPHTGNVSPVDTIDVYNLTAHEAFKCFDGRLYIEWGAGKRSWIQRAERQNKLVTELRVEFKEPEFPGYLSFVSSLSGLQVLPPSWIVALSASRGVYLLTCPRTKEQYVGAAYGENGFWQRWLDYAATGHGGNVMLKSRDPSDYQVSILEVVGSSTTNDELITIESRWKQKLQSREMGLNAN